MSWKAVTLLCLSSRVRDSPCMFVYYMLRKALMFNLAFSKSFWPQTCIIILGRWPNPLNSQERTPGKRKVKKIVLGIRVFCFLYSPNIGQNVGLFELHESLSIWSKPLKQESFNIPSSFSRSICQSSQLKMPLWAIIILFKEREGTTVNMSLVSFWPFLGVSSQPRASPSATGCEKELHLQKGQIYANTSRLAENSGSLEFHFHLFFLLSLNTVGYLFTHKPFSAAFKKTIKHLLMLLL